MSKKHNDSYRAYHNLKPRPMDTADKVVIFGSCLASFILLILLAGG